MDNQNLYNSSYVANNIKKYAKLQNVSLKSILENCELGSNTFSHMLHGKIIAYDSLARIADFLNCSVDFLLGRTDNPNIGNMEAYIGGDNHGVQAVRNNSVIIGSNAEQEIMTLLDKLSPSDRHRAIADIIDLLNEKYLI